MSTSHGVLQGYNANAVVDDANQVIVAAEVFGAGTDHGALPSLLEQTKKNLRQSGVCPTLADIVVTADTSYYSRENLAACEAAEVDAYIPDPKFRQRDPQLHDRERHRRPTLLKPDPPPPDPAKPTYFKPEGFTHEPEHNRLRCPAGKYFYSDGSGSVQRGRATHHFKAPLGACRDCPLRNQCLRKPHARSVRQVTIFGEPVKASQVTNPTLTHRMRDKIDTVLGRHLYRQRQAIVEPVFANICTHKGMRRFTLRSRRKSRPNGCSTA